MTDAEACPHCHGFGPSTTECEHADWQWQGWDICLPTHVVWAAIAKARELYIAVAVQEGRDPGPDTESWAEFERLSRYAGTEERVRARPTDLSDDELSTRPGSDTDR
jgi:hypothetical protein